MKHYLTLFAVVTTVLIAASTAHASGVAAMDSRMSQLESELRTLTGRVEQQEFTIRQLREELDKARTDLEMRVGDVERGRGTSSSVVSSSNTVSPSSVASSVNVSGIDYTPPSATSGLENTASRPSNLGTISSNNNNVSGVMNEYEAAFNLLRRRDYAASEVAFKDFLQRYPNDKLAANAQYWLAETYYVRGNYSDASKAFATAFRKYPDGPKAADSLLKLGLSLSGSGNTSDACVAFRQLDTAFPTAAPAIVDRAKLEMSKLNCSA